MGNQRWCWTPFPVGTAVNMAAVSSPTALAISAGLAPWRNQDEDAPEGSVGVAASVDCRGLWPEGAAGADEPQQHAAARLTADAVERAGWSARVVRLRLALASQGSTLCGALPFFVRTARVARCPSTRCSASRAAAAGPSLRPSEIPRSEVVRRALSSPSAAPLPAPWAPRGLRPR